MAKVTKEQVVSMLTDRSLGLDQRAMSLRMLAADPDETVQIACQQALEVLLKKQCNNETIVETQERLEQFIEELERGPQQCGVFIAAVNDAHLGLGRCLVQTEEGASLYAMCASPDLAKQLKRGDSIRLAMRQGAILGKGVQIGMAGETAKMTRVVDKDRVEVKTRADEVQVVYCAEDVAAAIELGECRPGSPLILNHRKTVALEWLQPQDSMRHYRFLERVPVPDVRVERDIGAPPKCIEELSEIMRLEMTNPDVRRKYKLRRCVMKLLSGVSGAGKTLAIHAIWRRMYEIMSEITGRNIEDLPPRVFWLRPSQLLSKWFGESEQLIESAMDEVQMLADEKITNKKGDEISLPVLVVLEEIDGIAKSRGDNDPVYGRVLTTLLQRLDSSQPALQQRFIVFIGTTNEPGQVDRAFLRRIGGSVEVFGRLDRKGFQLVLDKHLRGLPLDCDEGGTQAGIRQKFTNRLSSWLFDQNSDPGLVEITLNGQKPQVYRKSEFLTGGLIDRAVQQAASMSSDRESKSGKEGVPFEVLHGALNDQLLSLSDQLTAHNVGRYVTLPDGAQVARLQRIPQQPLSI